MNKITQQMVNDSIVSEHYFTAKDGRDGAIGNGTYCGVERPVENNADLEVLKYVTFCTIILQNGHKVVGVNTGSIDPADFNSDTGRNLARANAVDKIWELLGFEMRTKLSKALSL